VEGNPIWKRTKEGEAMKRAFACVAFAGAFLLVPCIVAGTVQKTTYWGAECIEALGPPEKAWRAGKTEHFRGIPGLLAEWVYYDGEWVQEGTNSTVVNVNATPRGDHLWGTFAFRSGIVGDFDGSWQLNPNGGKARGQGVDDSAGDLIKITLAATLPDDIPPGPEGCGVIKLVVFDH
jgi:hypothetical protein